ncbi:hypothetical protein COLO4_21404 [Corchorus olitorius]|uniref:Uncharacterized protein n=1 Tax=Corchorus olitorius TaxID=93759 RepID=A0A1R3ITH1_9ROSI|nr:hypothetical protein COLO4_21404 [Corchorus olitorius]
MQTHDSTGTKENNGLKDTGLDLNYQRKMRECGKWCIGGESVCCVNCVCEERIMWRIGRAVESLWVGKKLKVVLEGERLMESMGVVGREWGARWLLLREVNELARLVAGDENKLRWPKVVITGFSLISDFLKYPLQCTSKREIALVLMLI